MDNRSSDQTIQIDILQSALFNRKNIEISKTAAGLAKISINKFAQIF